MSRISQKQREEREAARRADGADRRRDRAVCAISRRLDVHNGINALLAQFIRQIERRQWAAETARDPHAELLEREAREDAAVILDQDRILARGGSRWTRDTGHDGSTAPAGITRQLATGPAHTASEWVRHSRGRWHWLDGDDLALVCVERGAWELRCYHDAGTAHDLDAGNKFSGLLLPDLPPARLRVHVSAWIAHNGTDPGAWGQFSRTGGASGTSANSDGATG